MVWRTRKTKCGNAISVLCSIDSFNNIWTDIKLKNLWIVSQQNYVFPKDYVIPAINTC